MTRSTFRNTKQDWESLAGRFVSERACERLLVSLTHVVDLGDIDKAGVFFTPDATYQADGRTATGRDQILALLTERREAVGATRHVLTNVRIQVADDRTSAAAIAYLQVFTAESTTPSWVGHLRDEFALDSESWKIARRSLEPLVSSDRP